MKELKKKEHDFKPVGLMQSVFWIEGEEASVNHIQSKKS